MNIKCKRHSSKDNSVCLTMTERCQTKFVEKNNNQNYIIYTGITVTLFAVLYFYRFHLVTIIFSYVLGCLACYYGLNLRFLQSLLEQYAYRILRKPPENKERLAPIKGCDTCGSKGCDRHDPDMVAEPWSGLHIHKQLDQAIEDFYNTILEQFINTWYSKITLQPFFIDELRHQLRYASASLVRRGFKINYARFIIDRLVPCALRHVTMSPDCVRPIHVAASNREAELRYLRCLTETLLPYLLRNTEVQNPVFRVLVREIFAGWVLLPLTDTLADPYILNTLIVLATSDEKMAALPTTPNYEVELLENFVRQSDSVYGQRARLLRVDLELLVTSPDHFYGFMQHLKTSNHIYLLQFYKDIKSFQSQILNPELSEKEQKELYSEAKRLYKHYLSTEVPRVDLPANLLQELQELLDAGPDCVKRLQTSRALYQAARQSHSALEKFMLPKFLHSEEFYKLFIGPRIPTGYNKQMTKRPQDKLSLLKLGSRLRSKFEGQALDGQVLETLDCEGTDEGTDDEVGGVDVLRYLDSLAAEDAGRDLSTYKVVITDVESRLQAPPRRGAVRVFTVGVHRVGPTPQLWAVQRSEHDFHLLRCKLQEFHGEALLAPLPLPSRRDNSPLETLRYKYEDFLQRLLRVPLLRTSELLLSFLAPGDFAPVPAPDHGLYQSVALRLRKERGQHLDDFLGGFLLACHLGGRPWKQGPVEEAQEVGEGVLGGAVGVSSSGVGGGRRDISRSVFGDNCGVRPAIAGADRSHQQTVVGLSQCLMFILIKVVKAPAFVIGIVGSILSMTRGFVDEIFTMILNRVLRDLLSERRLAHLIRLGHGLLFNKKASTPRMEEQQRSLALLRLGEAVPALLRAGLPELASVHTMLQDPALNKQLVYNLLDLCVVELFPELRNEDTSEGKS